MVEPAGCRVRLRVRITKALNTEDISRTINIAGREVQVCSQKRNQPLSEAVWIVFLAGGFSTEEEARDFGKRLITITEVAGLCSGLGVDVGQDKPTSWVSEEFARAVHGLQPHEEIFPNVHGLAIIPDDGSARFLIVEASGTVRAAPEHLLDAMTETATGLRGDISTAEGGVRLLNHALINPEPLAKITLSLSAVEALAQNERWTEKQSTLIRNLATQVDSNTLTMMPSYRKSLMHCVAIFTELGCDRASCVL
jgi:hypothetical protein